jgi:hypothetical protein
VGRISGLPGSIRKAPKKPPLAAEVGVTRHPGAGAACSTPTALTQKSAFACGCRKGTCRKRKTALSTFL